MNASEAHAVHLRESIINKLAGSMVGEALGAIAVMALAIVGLAGVFSTTMAAISTIILGAAILIQGGFFAVFGKEFGPARAFAQNQGLAAEFLGGLAAVILGLLTLLGVTQTTLLAVAILGLGSAYLLTSGMGTSFGTRTLVGLGAIVLGILAVVGLYSLTLVLVSLLCLGATSLFSEALEGINMTQKSDVDVR